MFNDDLTDKTECNFDRYVSAVSEECDQPNTLDAHHVLSVQHGDCTKVCFRVTTRDCTRLTHVTSQESTFLVVMLFEV